MALATQCPHCFTSFRVANDQLKLHAGMVRCGACKQTFNGIEYLLKPGQAPRTRPEHSAAPETSQSVSDSMATTENGSSETENIADESMQNQTLAESASECPTNNENSAPATAIELPDESPSLLVPSQDSITIHTEKEDASQSSYEDQDIEDADLSKDIITAAPTSTDIDLQDHIRSNEKSPVLDFDEDFSEQFLEEESQQEVEEAHAQKTRMLEQFSEQLETIEPALGVQAAAIDARLSSKIEFELTKEQRDLVEQANHLHTLELENRLAILDDNAKEWSKNEASIDQEFLLETDITQEQSKPDESAISVKSPIATRHQELLESTTDINEASADNDTEDASATPSFVLLAEKNQRYGKWRTLGLSLVCLLLALGILAQSTYFLRNTIAAQFPATKPWLSQACQLLNCQIKLPAERRMLDIAGSELLILHDELRINTLSFQIQNRSNTAQEWPVAELTLKDARGKVVLHKFILPMDYLNNKTELARGIPARSESDHKLHFELNSLKASNYAMGIFYP